MWVLINQIRNERGYNKNGEKIYMIVPIYKQKGDMSECGNYSRIKLLDHGLVILKSVVGERLTKEAVIDATQNGFVKGRGTTITFFL